MLQLDIAICMKHETSEPTEVEVRKMRDEIFEHVASDSNWDACKEYWMQAAKTSWIKAKSDAQFEALEKLKE